MTFIEQLLNGENVEWKKLGEVCEIKRGTTLAKSDKDINGNIPIILYGELYTTYGNYINTIASYTTIEKASKGTVAKNGDILLPISSTTKEAKIGKASAISVDTTIYIGGDAIILSHTQVPGYLVYLLNGSWFEKLKMKCVTGTTIMHLSPKKLSNILIPLPPLSVQHKIVEILDKFTALEAELEAELDCRKRQYEYYRNQLLSFDMLNRGGQKLNSVNVMTLGEIGEIRMCKRILKGQTSTCGDVPFYKIGTFGKTPNAFISKKLFTEYKIKYSYPKIGEVLISASGTIGKTVIFDGQDAYFQDSNIVWIENDESMALNKYLYYCYQVIKWKTAEGGTINRLYNDIIKKTQIPLPPLSVQREIVEILDKFDTLCNSISEGLPKEIELRRKQYEYYRNQLLTFAQ